ncbi:DUF2339 domain-containing protein [Oceanobacillus senegalensis]|uniref:DUF2339 domain-containing protein n=1 Tax=Oceanobacillus senegalensis TaxID=1936063 RepID=UPI000A312998|nr:DUF2339 domain-containing protein [Oceanobacillus senegalensis]
MERERIEKLEARIVQLEKEVAQLKGERKKPIHSPVEKVHKPIKMKKIREPDNPNVHHTTKEKKEHTDWETLIGKVWLPRIFIFVLLLGVVWGFRIAVDAGWLNETNRIIIGFIVAGLFYYIGSKQIRKNRIALGKVLLVGFISTLLVTTFAMHILYGMIPSSIAFLLNGLWVAFGIYLSHLHRSQAMGVMFAIAGYLIPFLVTGNGTTTTMVMVIVYELIYYIALLWFAARNQYRVLFYVSSLFLHIVYIALMVAANHVLDSTLIFIMTLAILIQHEVIFYTLVKGKIEKLKAFPVLFSSFVITLLWAKIGFAVYVVSYLFPIYVLLTTIRYGWVAYQAKMKEKANLFSILIVTTTIGISVLILDLVESPYVMASLYLIQGASAVYVGYTFQSKVQKISGYLIYYGMTLFIIGNPYIGGIEDIILWGVLIGTLYFQVWFSQKGKDETFFQLHISAFLLAHVLFLAGLDHYVLTFGPLYWMVIIGSLYGLYRLIKEHMNIVIKQIYQVVNVLIHLQFISYLAGEFIFSTNAQVLLTTAGWALYALGCVYIGMKKQYKSLRLAGIGLIFFTLLKLIFFDLAFISLTTRSILFVFIGLIGILVSRFIYGKYK